MRVFVPSMGRVSGIPDGPMLDIPETTIVCYVVPPDEAGDYRRVLAPWSNAVVLSCPERGIAATRRWIGEWCRDAGVDRFLMLDDDIRFLVRRGWDTWRLRGTKPHEVVAMLDLVDHLLGDHGHVGISAREGNNRLGEGEPTSVVAENTRTLRALAYRTDDFLSVEHGRVEVMEDFDVNLQLLRRGIPNCNIGYWAQGQKMTNAPGGCSLYRSHEVHERSAHRLAELHPGLVRLRQKENKTDREGFGTRTEVTISWKRAFSERSS